MASRQWTSEDIGDFGGRTVLITGATSGLGLASAQVLAAHGAHVILAGRNPQKLNDAEGSISGPIRPTKLRLDLADLASVRRAAAEVKELVPELDVLINNAGVMAPPLSHTADGFESQIGTNHLGHFALTGLLLGHLGGGRVVTVSSNMHHFARLDVDDLNFEHRRYEAWSAYGQSKLANLLFAAELDRRAASAESGLVSVAAHPGYARTNLQYAGPMMSHNPIGRSMVWLANRTFAQSAHVGALPQLFAATAPNVVGGEFYGPSGFRGMRGHPGLSDRSGTAGDAALAARLWSVSEQLTGVEYRW